jgi:hypothetical protein
VKSCSDVQTLTARASGRELKKRDLNIVDENNDMVCSEFTILKLVYFIKY